MKRKMTKLSAIQLSFVIFQLFFLICITFVFAQSVTPTSTTIEPTQTNSQIDLNQSTTTESTTAATSVSENLTTSTDGSNIFLSTELSTESNLATSVPPDQPESHPFNYDLFFCTCDLTGEKCDVNCCCDPDCQEDDLRLFNNRCWSPPSSYFDRFYCSPDPDRYGVVWNNTPEFHIQWNSHNGMFCIVTDNVPKLSGRWKNPQSQPTIGLEQWIYQPFYKEGSPIFTLHMNGNISVLKLPRSLNSASCNAVKTVSFLESDDYYQCSLPAKDGCNPTIRLDEWLANLAVFRLPSYSASSNGNVRWGDMDKLAPLVIRICEDSNSGCRSDIQAPEPSCRNSLAAVTLRITHNGTEGIRSVLVDLLYTAVAGPVRFQTIHQSLVEINLKGKPLLVAKINSSSGTFQTMDVFPGTPKSRLIRFGEDSYHAFRMNGLKMDNRTQWCANWSHFVMEFFWGPKFESLRLGAFGNVQLNETEISGLWLDIKIRMDELSCFESVIHGELVVVYTKSGSYDQPQNKLLGAGLQLRSSGADCVVESSKTCFLQFSQTVSFVMSDSPTFMVLPQPPRWKIQLPYDFFYPFLLSSSADSVGPEIFVYVITLLSLCFSLSCSH